MKCVEWAVTATHADTPTHSLSRHTHLYMLAIIRTMQFTSAFAAIHISRFQIEMFVSARMLLCGFLIKTISNA